MRLYNNSVAGDRKQEVYDWWPNITNAQFKQ